MSEGEGHRKNMYSRKKTTDVMAKLCPKCYLPCGHPAVNYLPSNSMLSGLLGLIRDYPTITNICDISFRRRTQVLTNEHHFQSRR